MNQCSIVAGGYDSIIIFSPLTENDKFEIKSQELNAPQINRIIPYQKNFLVASNPDTHFISISNSCLNKVFKVHDHNVTDIVCINDIFYTCSEDKTWASWKLNKSIIRRVSTDDSLNCIEVTRDEEYVFVGNDRGEVQVFNTKVSDYSTPFKIELSSLPVRSLALNKHNTRLVAACQDGNVFILGLNINNLKLDIIDKIKAHDDVILRVVISPDQSSFVTTSTDYSARLWDFVETDGHYSNKPKYILRENNQKEFVWDAEFTADSKYVVTGGSDNILRTWSTENGDLIFSNHLSNVYKKLCNGITALTVL